jgi:F-box and WD-40 domain protein 1/11
MSGNPNAQFSGPPYMHPFRPASSMSANRFDEGYSEDTRSQNEGDMVMRNDSRLSDSEMEPESSSDLPDWVLALSENERSGRLRKPRSPGICANRQ